MHNEVGTCRYGGITPDLFTSILNGSEWPASLFCRRTLAERDPSTHRAGEWVGPEIDLDATE
jgi:hypothetical protein